MKPVIDDNNVITSKITWSFFCMSCYNIGEDFNLDLGPLL